MLIYVESEVFPRKTFIVIVNTDDTIARARSQILHILFEMAQACHQFRFRWNEIYLRDAYTFEDYKIIDQSVIKMIPMSKRKNGKRTNKDNVVHPSTSNANSFLFRGFKKKYEEIDPIQKALLSEVKSFTRRETLLDVFRIFLWVQFVAMLLAPTTSYPYSGIWIGLLVFYGFHYCPKYSRASGYLGKISMSNETYLMTLGSGVIVSLLASSLIGSIVLLNLIAHGCSEFFAGCSHQNVWSVVFNFCEAILLFALIILMLLLYRNFKIKIGDRIEYCLIQNKDLEKVLESAKRGSKREKRNAAFDLASLVVTGDEIKHNVAKADGIETLMNLALSDDEATQEYATEALAELVTVEAIQTQFVDLGGARVLCALLHSKSDRLLIEAVMAISYIVASSDVNRHAIVADTGICDLARAVSNVSLPCQGVIGGIFLELAFNSDIRASLANNDAALDALMKLLASTNDSSKRFALQTLELLSIENSDTIIKKDEILLLLLSICKESMDDSIQVLSGKVLMYYAESERGAHLIVSSDSTRDVLMQFAMSPDAILQSLASRIIISLDDVTQSRQNILSFGAIEILSHILENSLDREAWELADTATDVMRGRLTLQIKKKKSVSSSEGGSSSTVSILKTK